MFKKGGEISRTIYALSSIILCYGSDICSQLPQYITDKLVQIFTCCIKLTHQRVALIEFEEDNEACDDSNNRNSNGCENDNINNVTCDDLIEEMSDSSDDSLDD